MHLTAQQRDVVDAPGDFLLLACPGSGKTRCSAARVAERVRGHAKIAVCSYTNVGVERIGTLIAGEFGAVLGPQHFLGTIHGFLLRFVVYPFAHMLGAPQGPHVREGSWPEVHMGGDPKKPIPLDAFRRTRSGALTITAHPRYLRHLETAEIVASVGEEVSRRKDGLFRKAGVVSADDAMWIALRILTQYPGIAAAVAQRFEELLLDEAQDTSELQLACLHRLRATGKLASLVLVGDLEQSIFSFQGASAPACRKLATYHGLGALELTENHRSSQPICDVAAHFCSRGTPDTAVGPDADCEIRPEVVLYPPTNMPAAMTLFRSRLAEYEISPKNAAVLVRSWSVADALIGEPHRIKIEDRPRRVGRIAQALAGGTLTRRHVQQVQSIVSYSAWGAANLDELDENQREQLKVAAYAFVRNLPPLEGDLQTWIKACARELDRIVRSLVAAPAHSGGLTLRSSAVHSKYTASAAFFPPPHDLIPQTVHDIKGEDREAVMVVIHEPHGSDPTRQLALWEATVTGTAIEEDQQEERRITFVALTRAQRYCLVALPDDSRGRSVAAACLDLGFVAAG
jgi:DNA helicase-2/ATP-dependent DNA helicase PcrA